MLIDHVNAAHAAHTHARAQEKWQAVMAQYMRRNAERSANLFVVQATTPAQVRARVCTSVRVQMRTLAMDAHRRPIDALHARTHMTHTHALYAAVSCAAPAAQPAVHQAAGAAVCACRVCVCMRVCTRTRMKRLRACALTRGRMAGCEVRARTRAPTACAPLHSSTIQIAGAADAKVAAAPPRGDERAVRLWAAHVFQPRDRRQQGARGVCCARECACARRVPRRGCHAVCAPACECLAARVSARDAGRAPGRAVAGLHEELRQAERDR